MFLEYDRKQSPSKIKIAVTILQYLKLAIRDRVSPAPFRQI
jgi:dolichol-phosphate mannosyltransferase